MLLQKVDNVFFLMHPELVCLTVSRELNPEVLSDGTEIGDTKVFCDLHFGLIKEGTVIRTYQTIAYIPHDNANDSHPLTVNVVEDKHCIVSLTMEEAQTSKYCPK